MTACVIITYRLNLVITIHCMVFCLGAGSYQVHVGLFHFFHFYSNYLLTLHICKKSNYYNTCFVPYSGKVSHGANFRAFCGWVGYRVNKNSESLTEKERNLKPQKILLEVVLAKARKFAPATISHYMVSVSCLLTVTALI